MPRPGVSAIRSRFDPTAGPRRERPTAADMPVGPDGRSRRSATRDAVAEIAERGRSRSSGRSTRLHLLGGRFAFNLRARRHLPRARLPHFTWCGRDPWTVREEYGSVAGPKGHRHFDGMSAASTATGPATTLSPVASVATSGCSLRVSAPLPARPHRRARWQHMQLLDVTDRLSYQAPTWRAGVAFLHWWRCSDAFWLGTESCATRSG